MTRRRPRRAILGVLATVAVALLAVACGGGADEERLVLDGRPRLPDAEGVAVSISHTEIVLDGDRRYAVADGFKSFSTYTLALEPMVSREGDYVQLGLDADDAVWMAGIGGVLHTDPPTVLYEGRLDRVEGRRAIFRDGTVLRLAPGVSVPDVDADTFVVAEIDPARRAVGALRPR